MGLSYRSSPYERIDIIDGSATRVAVGATNAETDIRGAVARRAGRAVRRVRANILGEERGSEGGVKGGGRRWWVGGEKVRSPSRHGGRAHQRPGPAHTVGKPISEAHTESCYKPRADHGGISIPDGGEGLVAANVRGNVTSSEGQARPASWSYKTVTRTVLVCPLGFIRARNSSCCDLADERK